MPGFLGGSGASSGGAGGQISFPKEFIDPVTKLRVSQPENLIDTDFEYGLQPTKWETVELINNTPSFFSKSGDTTIPGIRSISTTQGTREIIVTTSLDHGLAVGIPINVQGTKSVTADGSYIINSIPDTRTFTYLSRDIQETTSSIEDLYTSIITGEFFQGSQLRIAEADGIVTDAGSPSTLTVTTENPHGFGPNSPFYFLNLNSTISQEFEAANTAAKSFDASNSATAQTFDGSNTLSSLNIDWSNSATVGGTVSTVQGSNSTDNTITVAHSTESFSGLPIGQPLYYNVSASLGYFAVNPRGVVFLKTNTDLDAGSSTFQVSDVPDGDAINIESNITGTFQIANQARTFAGNNVNPDTQTVIDVLRADAFNFEGANDQALGGNGDSTITGFNSPFIDLSTSAGAGLDYYIGAMVKYETTGSAASGLVDENTYFISSFQDLGSDNYRIALKEFPTDQNLISVSGGTGTQTFTRIGLSLDKDIVHIKNSFFAEKDMLEYEYPTSGAFEADAEQNFYFVTTAFDEHNYLLNPVTESLISATGGDVTQTFQDSDDRNYTIHRFLTAGTYTFTVTDAGTFDQNIKYVVTNGSFDSDTENGVFAASTGAYTVVVNSGGRVDIAYPQDEFSNDIEFNTIYAQTTQATGGSVSDVTIEGREYRIHSFTSTGSSTFEVTSAGIGADEVEVLLVGGGGASSRYSGGGGGGEVVYIPQISVEEASYPVVVGAGGIGDTTNSWSLSKNGGQSSIFNQFAKGGGGGRGSDDDSIPVSGGGTDNRVANGGAGSSRSVGYRGSLGSFNDGVTGTRSGGNLGGRGANNANYPSGGGAGAGGDGSSQTNNLGDGAPGGPGVLNDILGVDYYWGGGGGGQTYYDRDGRRSGGGNGGIGGGGAGSGRGAGATGGGSALNSGGSTGRDTAGGNGGANTGGGGGGGAGENSRRGGNGGSGIVIVKYPLEPASGGN